MANKKISQLTAKGTALAATDLVEISESDGAGGYVSKSVSGLQPTLVSGTNIASINLASILGGGNLSLQTPLVSGTSIKTINSNSILGSGDLVVGGTEIGAQIGGGIVIAVFNDAGVNKALVASLTNLSTGLPYTIPAYQAIAIGATAQSFFNGLANTDAIIAQTLLPATTAYAAGIARLFAGGGFSDWYLPSTWELNMCFNSAAIVNKILGANGFVNTTYSSSNEGTASTSKTLDFLAGAVSNSNKSFVFYVRAVRIHTI